MSNLSQNNLLRNVFNKKNIQSLAETIHKNYPEFQKGSFIKVCLKDFDSLNFKPRSDRIRDTLYTFLPKDFPKACSILIESLGSPIDFIDGETDWNNFIIMPQTSFVGTYGKKHFDISMKALHAMTQRFTAEYDLRVFLEIDYDRAMKYLYQWARDPSHHVRRLVSEGTRPRLPLGGRIKRFQEDPTDLLDLLEKLLDDEVLYVRRSVANCLNDISKDNPVILLDRIKIWNKKKTTNRNWLIQHSLRSLIKSGNQDAMEILGFQTKAAFALENLSKIPRKISLGETIQLAISIQSKAKEVSNFSIDYRIYFMKKNRKLAPKTFKFRKIQLEPGEIKLLLGKFTLRPLSTRILYPGKHRLEWIINGKIIPSSEWVLIA